MLTILRRSRKWKSLFKLLLFVSLAAIVVCSVNRTLRPQYRWSNSSTPVSSSYSGFYGMERNSIDVLLLGSSQIATGINPLDLYESAGIRSYCLASNGQRLWLTYYWLEEALQYQSPKVVVLECLSLFFDIQQEEDSIARMTLDDMREGPVKWKAVQTAASLTDSSELSYHLSNIRYHTRWTDLEPEDFLWQEDPGEQAMGLYKSWAITEDTAYTPIDTVSMQGVLPASFGAGVEEYLDKIVALCEKNEIELVLIKTPAPSETAERNAAIQNYAQENGIPFYDFNVKELYDEIGFDYSTDMRDSASWGDLNAHANPLGARKMSTYLAKKLLGVNGLSSVSDSQWEEALEFNELYWQNFVLACEENFLSYLKELDQDRYSIFIAARDDASTSVTDEITLAMQALGFTFDLKDHYRYSYIAIRNEGEITEILTEDTAEAGGAVRDGSTPYFVISAGMISGDTSSILIGGEEYSMNQRGLNIVVYDNEIDAVIDSVCFDTYDSSLTATR